MSFEGVQLDSIKLLNSHALEFSHRNRSVCYIHHNVTSSNINCLNVDDFTKQWVLPKPSIFSNLDSKYKCLINSTVWVKH